MTMRKKLRLFMVSVLTMVACLAAAAVTTHTVTYDFSTVNGLTSLGITVPQNGGRTNLDNNATFTVGDVTLTSINSTTTSYSNSIYYYTTAQSYELYLNSGASLSFSVPANCTITAINFNANNLNYLNGATDGNWTGSQQSVTFSATTKTVYIFSVTVTYNKTDVQLPQVTGISNFKNVTPGTSVRLYLPDNYNARVLAVKQNVNGTTDAYIRDNSGAMLMQGISPNRPMAYNQHLAGWIDGQYTTNANGLPCFVPVNGLTNTSYLVIADPVTEANVEPRSITPNQYDNYLADWVTMSDVRIAQGLTLSNGLDISGYTPPYAGALVDVSAIVAGNGMLYPLSQTDTSSITFVVDASQEFVSPPQPLVGVRVRLNRTFSAGAWVPFTLPFTTNDFAGEIMEYSALTKGAPMTGSSGNTIEAGTMHFSRVAEMEAGMPYLVRSSEDVDGKIYEDVTLVSTGPGTVTMTTDGLVQLNVPGRIASTDAYSFVGTFKPVTIELLMSNKVVLADGSIDWVNQETRNISGTGAYFVTPEDQGLHVEMHGVADGTFTVVSRVTDDAIVQHKGIYNMLGVKMNLPWSELPPGIYVVNGRKMIKR